MKYMDFYNRLNNPIEDKETLRKLCDVYANSLYYPGEFYGGLTSIYDRKPSWNYNQKDKDEFYVYTFNKYKVGFIKLVDQYYDNLKSKPKVLETYLKVRDYFLSLPEMTPEQDVKKAFNPKTDDVSLKDMLRKLNWDNYSSSWTIMQSSAVNLRKEEQFDVEHRLYLNIDRQDFYIPGNHDSFVYDYGKYNDDYSFKNLQANKAFRTIQDMDEMRVNNSQKFHELMNWLGELPLQRIHEYDGKKYALAHAFFNQKVYEEKPYLSLEDLHRTNLYDDNFKKYMNILWYRKYDKKYFGEVDPQEVSVDAVMVIGHTPYHSRGDRDLSLMNETGDFPNVVCVDGGIAYGGDMLKFDGGNYANRTKIHEHNDTSPKAVETDDEIPYLKEEFAPFRTALCTAVTKYGLGQAFTIVDKIITGDLDWYWYVSENCRAETYEIGLSKLQGLLNPYVEATDTRRLAIETFITDAYLNDSRFMDAVDMANEGSGFVRETPTNSGRSSSTYSLKKGQIIQDDLSGSKVYKK